MIFFKKSSRKILKNNIIASLDIGSSKVCCAIASIDSNNELQLIGIGQQASFGLKGGVVVDMRALESCILNAIHSAEQVAQETINEVYISVSSNQLNFHKVHGELSILGNEIKDVHVDRLLYQSKDSFEKENLEAIHTIPVNYNIDDMSGIRDPRGMYGDTLSADICLITAKVTSLRNLLSCVARCHLDVNGIVASTYASALSTLVDDEMSLGVTVIDLGAGSTSIASFINGDLIFIDTVSVGGSNITYDIARGLSTPIVHAERLKTLYGSAISSSSDNREVILVPQIGEQDKTQGLKVQKSILNQIIHPRIEETFELIKSRIQNEHFNKIAGNKIVLTGGASQLFGIREVAERVLNKQVRMGNPIHINGIDKMSARGPNFSGCLGLLSFALKQSEKIKKPGIKGSVDSYLSDVWAWLRENL